MRSYLPDRSYKNDLNRGQTKESVLVVTVLQCILRKKRLSGQKATGNAVKLQLVLDMMDNGFIVFDKHFAVFSPSTEYTVILHKFSSLIEDTISSGSQVFVKEYTLLKPYSRSRDF